MINKLIILIFLTQVIGISLAQDLFNERIRKIDGRKKSVYLDSGILHNGGSKRLSKLKAIRHSYTKRAGYERIVFDFSTDVVPRIYGYLSGKQKKIYLDLFYTELLSNVGSFGTSRYIKNIKFFPTGQDIISVELDFKDVFKFDIFSLKKPGRLVIDVKQ